MSWSLTLCCYHPLALSAVTSNVCQGTVDGSALCTAEIVAATAVDSCRGVVYKGDLAAAGKGLLAPCVLEVFASPSVADAPASVGKAAWWWPNGDLQMLSGCSCCFLCSTKLKLRMTGA
jgi:hypothetical protein